MELFGKVMPYLYMAAFIAIGWRLFVLRWDWRLKALSGLSMVIAPPLMFILPALRQPDGQFSDLMLATGIGMLVTGLICLTGGIVAAWLRRRHRKA